MIKTLHKMGLRSHMMYTAGMASIGFTVVSWVLSKEYEGDIARADRWGLFVGEWAPTFFALGVGLRIEEMRHESGMSMGGQGYEEMMPDEAMSRRYGSRTPTRI
ncbi:hypothetical protein [Sphaerisporangium sp. TRM90804]|uniref:hypothetical protein n=1 Tax=Sphaerisporangium sp. TRM90804 TaxID=3031113 RepID=UPI00244C6014|nr:hypothetical protein [Sphaerisporangium sp. TRM90804]MDH2430873.1 hypothetical protein [Sphaerisporangium sp. TRM90804]